ncbi:MAG: TrkA family potassium uptake protein [Oscillospiraceae bacterium]|nr:TrkA family potassium uptake protein [Oscillospiraceae bacterium]
MKLFTNKKNGGCTIIAGCGRLGANLANTLSNDGKDVVIIDINPTAFRKLHTSFGGIIMAGDATEMLVLEDAGIENATAVIAVTNNDNTNILIAQLAKEMFNIGQIIARLYDPEREYVYHEFGIETILPAVLSAKEIDRLLGIQEGDDKTA